VIDLGVMVPSQTILDKAKEFDVDIIGLSGLITPSLDEMVRVASEMERLGFTTPLLIGGATTSRLHTSLRIDPAYHGPVVHVGDASRASGVISALLSNTQREGFLADLEVEYARVVESHARATVERDRVTLDVARANGPDLTFDHTTITEPTFTGTQVFDDYDVAELVPYIDWTPFFRTWGIRSKFPEVLTDPEFAEAAKPLYDDAVTMLDKIVSERWFRPKAVVGFWPAHADGDDVVVYTDESRTAERTRLHGIRQQATKTDGRANLSLSDYIAAAESGTPDWVGGFVVTAGPEEIAIAERFEADNDDYSSILLKALADRIAEAFAERMHERVRTELWGYAPDEAFSPAELLKENFQGIRPAPGYPSQPDHTEKQPLFDLLDATNAVGVELTESFAMWPGSSVSGLYFAHPDAKYFGVGKIKRDQLNDYAARKGWTVEEAEQHLAPILDGN
jgi:5-methyltetrahydrofolate--homocysteine methyltransferase